MVQRKRYLSNAHRTLVLKKIKTGFRSKDKQGSGKS